MAVKTVFPLLKQCFRAGGKGLFLMWCDDGRLLNCSIHKFETSVGSHVFFSCVSLCCVPVGDKQS